jgi:hypothetical protein
VLSEGLVHMRAGRIWEKVKEGEYGGNTEYSCV